MLYQKKRKKQMYPQELQNQTKLAFENIDKSPLKNLNTICMKNDDGRFGTIQHENIKNGIFHIRYENSNGFYMYFSLDEMLQDGWVVD